MINSILFIIWYFLPAGVANIIPIFFSKLPIFKNWEYPLDFNKTLNGKRIFGENKTLRGMISGIAFAIIVVYLEVFFYKNNTVLQQIIPDNYLVINPFILGLLAGAGALIGDAIKSFFKRRIGVKSGRSWFPFDQIDYVIGGALFMSLYFPLKPAQYLLLFIFWFLVHPLATFIGYLLKLKKSPI